MTETTALTTAQEALDFHSSGRPGKFEIAPTKPVTTQRDLSLAYSPGVAEPCKRIHEDPGLAYDPDLNKQYVEKQTATFQALASCEWVPYTSGAN